MFEEAKDLARRTGRPRDGIEFIERKASEGEPEANLIVAHWFLYGSDRPRDLKVARRHLEAAANNGNTHAVRVLANLVSGGIGCEPDGSAALVMLRQIAGRDEVAAAQLALLPMMMSEADAADAKRERLSLDPAIELVKQLLLPHEREYIMRLATPVLKRSLVYEPGVDHGKVDPIRKSEGAALLPHDEDLVIQAINRRLASVTGTGIDQREALYVIRYIPGEEYRPHFDALPGLANQRAWTAICYLNDDYDGGETDFPELGLSIRGTAGDVLIFTNVDAEGRPDPRMRHAGKGVTGGFKWIATRWIRERAHDPYEQQ
ncbi:MAG TPA: 2OG-Fe(II) oxygenase [Sphingomicrobium sp.]|nr:2OG-Fe(II) oxygenase [Sphingomicrobium sp.]